MTFDVFISYASKDKTVADAVCARLETAGIRCWIAPRDIMAGTSYGESIIEAIHNATVMVLVFSSNANSSGHIPKEVERAMSAGVAILPFRIEDVMPAKSLDYFIGSVHWLDAMTPPIEKHLDDLATTVHKLIPAKSDEEGATPLPVTGIWQHGGPALASKTSPTAAVPPAATPGTVLAISNKTLWTGFAAIVLIAVVISGMLFWGNHSHEPVDKPAPLSTASTANPPASTTEMDHASSASDSATKSGGNPVRKAPAPTPPSAPPSPQAVADHPDPLVGCYQWYANGRAGEGRVVIRTDGTVVAGRFVGHWRLVDTSKRAYALIWPENIETMTISRDQQSISGWNQFGYSTSGTRMAGKDGLTGTWRWSNGKVVTISSNGTFLTDWGRGKWRVLDEAQQRYELTWPNPVNNVTLLAGNTRLSGADLDGVAIAGEKAGGCGGN
jgi:hypothetical protein